MGDNGGQGRLDSRKQAGRAARRGIPSRFRDREEVKNSSSGVTALNASDGYILWRFEADPQLMEIWRLAPGKNCLVTPYQATLPASIGSVAQQPGAPDPTAQSNEGSGSTLVTRAPAFA